MYLDVGRVFRGDIAASGTHAPSVPDVFEPWRDWAPATISHHGSQCCNIGREWIKATDFSSLIGGHPMTGPRWLRERFEWGPSCYPIFWCEAVARGTLDCGVLAAMAYEVFTGRGVTAFRAQLVQQYSHEATEQWSLGWSGSGVTTKWLTQDLAYHEGVAVLSAADTIKIWDASSGVWIEPKAGRGYGDTRAVKITAPSRSDELAWGSYIIEPGRWIAID